MSIIRTHDPRFAVYTNEAVPHDWVLMVQHGGKVDDFIKEIFNYMVSENIIAMYLDKQDIKELREEIKGMLH